MVDPKQYASLYAMAVSGMLLMGMVFWDSITYPARVGERA